MLPLIEKYAPFLSPIKKSILLFLHTCCCLYNHVYSTSTKREKLLLNYCLTKLFIKITKIIPNECFVYYYDYKNTCVKY